MAAHAHGCAKSRSTHDGATDRWRISPTRGAAQGADEGRSILVQGRSVASERIKVLHHVGRILGGIPGIAEEPEFILKVFHEVARLVLHQIGDSVGACANVDDAVQRFEGSTKATTRSLSHFSSKAPKPPRTFSAVNSQCPSRSTGKTVSK
jgi:hypothetical protein